MWSVCLWFFFFFFFSYFSIIVNCAVKLFGKFLGDDVCLFNLIGLIINHNFRDMWLISQNSADILWATLTLFSLIILNSYDLNCNLISVKFDNFPHRLFLYPRFRLRQRPTYHEYFCYWTILSCLIISGLHHSGQQIVSSTR